jgi:hypothetical protein
MRFQPVAGRRPQGASPADHQGAPAANFNVTFDLALYALCVNLFDRFRTHARPIDLRAIEAAPRRSLNDLSGTPADRLIEARGCALDLDWLKLPPAEGFAVLAALPIDAKQRLFAGASLPASSCNLRSRTRRTRSSNAPAAASRSRSPISGGRPPRTIGAA